MAPRLACFHVFKILVNQWQTLLTSLLQFCFLLYTNWHAFKGGSIKFRDIYIHQDLTDSEMTVFWVLNDSCCPWLREIKGRIRGCCCSKCPPMLFNELRRVLTSVNLVSYFLWCHRVSTMRISHIGLAWIFDNIFVLRTSCVYKPSKNHHTWAK